MEKRDGSLRAVSTGMCRELCFSATPLCSVPASLQTDPGEYSPSSTTRWQGHALPCLTCTWPPAFVSAILLLSIGPGGSVREESTRSAFLVATQFSLFPMLILLLFLPCPGGPAGSLGGWTPHSPKSFLSGTALAEEAHRAYTLLAILPLTTTSLQRSLAPYHYLFL